MNLHTDISYKYLYKKLLNLLAEDSTIFTETWIVVPNHSAKQWLQKSIARDMGICAQIKFIMPLSFNWEIIKNVATQEHEINIFTKDVLRWQVYDFLSNDSKYQFLKQDSDIKNFNLAEKIAQTLLKYNDEHPEIIAKWDGEVYEVSIENQWQVEMWQQLQNNLPTKSPVELLALFNPKTDFKQPPANIILFATEQLSSLQKASILKLAKSQDIHLFLTNPCPDDYWFDIKPEATKARSMIFNSDVADIIDVGNPILSSLGYNKMAIFDAFLQEDIEIIQGNHTYTGKTLLQNLKQDIFHLHEEPPQCDVDNSIEIHSCHNRKREVEVIKDVILASLDSDKHLNPEDIVVVSADINDYVQSIKEVFNYENSQYLPYHIDRVQLADNHYITALMKLLTGFNQEMTATNIYQILSQIPVLQKFSISENDLPRAKRWMLDSNIRNFYSKQHKSELGFEAKSGNTWQFGRNRWLTGYLVGDVDDTAYLSTYGDIAGQENLFSKCFEFLELWYQFYQKAQKIKTPEKWFEFITEICQCFLFNELPDDFEKKILDQLENKFITQTLSSQLEIPLVVVNAIVEKVITENNYRSEGQIGIRFQSWENAFIVDAKLLIITGLNDGEFPKKQIKDDLDIFSKTPARLNKSTRQRDKNLMLTALTENSQKLVMTYIGFEAKSNEPQPPSVLLAELIDYLQQKTNNHFKVCQHKMHGYNKLYFSTNRHSYNLKQYQLAKNFYNPQTEQNQQEIALDKEVQYQLSLNELITFFVDPLQYFLKTQAQINHPIDQDVLQDTETYCPTALESWQLKQEIFIHGKSTAGKTGIISDNKSGQSLLDKFEYSLESLQQLLKDKKLKTHTIELSIGEYNIFGNLEIEEKQQLISTYPSKLSAKNLCKHWVKHLCYHPEQESFAHFEDKSIQFYPVVNGAELLAYILDKWQLSFNQPWLFCPSALIKIGTKKFALNERKIYLNKFKEGPNSFPSEGQIYFYNQVEAYPAQSDIVEFIQPLIDNLKVCL